MCAYLYGCPFVRCNWKSFYEYRNSSAKNGIMTSAENYNISFLFKRKTSKDSSHERRILVISTKAVELAKVMKYSIEKNGSI